MNEELKTAMEVLEREKNISSDTLFDAIESALIIACKNNFGSTDNIKVAVDRETFEYHVWAVKTIVESPEEVEDPQYQITAEDAKKQHISGEIGDQVQVNFNSTSFGRIATTIAKNVILQKIREEERNAVYNYYSGQLKKVMTGIVQRQVGKSWTVNLGSMEGSFKAEGILNEKEQVPGEHIRVNQRLKVYVVDVRKNAKGAMRVLLSRTHPDLVKGLFADEVAEIRDGTVEIKSIAREPGSRTKIAVWSSNPNVDPVGACVGLNGTRVNSIVNELNGEKIDIVNWDENPGNLIQNALSPAKIVAVFADPEERTAKVVVPDYQLSLAIGREGQNARLAARLTGYKIDIKDETQAKDAPGFRYEDYLEPEEDEETVYEYVDEFGNPVDEYGNPIEYVEEEYETEEVGEEEYEADGAAEEGYETGDAGDEDSYGGDEESSAGDEDSYGGNEEIPPVDAASSEGDAAE